MAEKQFFWLKLKDNFFDEKYVKALRRLPNGDTLTIIYIKMQLKSLNTDGHIYYENFLTDSISELAMTLDENEDDVKAAVEALVRFGAVERQEDETIFITSMQESLSSESSSAERVRKHRANKTLQCNAPVTICNTECNTECNIPVTDCNTECNTPVTDCNTECNTEIDIDIELEKDIESEVKTSSRFHPPTLEEVTAYCLERKNSVDPQRFIDYYTANGWLVGRGKMKDWKAAVRNWEGNEYNKPSPPIQTAPPVSNSSLSIELLEQSAYERYRKIHTDNSGTPPYPPNNQP